MKLLIIGLLLLLTLIIAFVVSGIAVNKHNMKKNKYDLLNYFKNHKVSLSLTIKENGRNTLAINPDKKYPLASTMKIIIAYNFVKSAMNNKISIAEKVKLNELEKFYIKDTDGGAHLNWKYSINYPIEVSLLEIAKGMMQYSSNACTDFLIHKIGVDVVNESIEVLQLNHDKITYLTSPIIMPGYLSDKRKLALNKLDAMSSQSYHELANELFVKMQANRSDYLKEKTPKMLDRKMQLLITKRMAYSTTNQYTDLMLRLGKELLTKKEKKLFSEIVIGKSVKSDKDDYFWYKGGATPYVLTSALYKESQDTTISVSLFIEDDKGGDLYWIRTIFNDFVISVATDTEFRKKVKEMA